jgi:hypothetical protein
MASAAEGRFGGLVGGVPRNGGVPELGFRGLARFRCLLLGCSVTLLDLDGRDVQAAACALLSGIFWMGLDFGSAFSLS